MSAPSTPPTPAGRATCSSANPNAKKATATTSAALRSKFWNRMHRICLPALLSGLTLRWIRPISTGSGSTGGRFPTSRLKFRPSDRVSRYPALPADACPSPRQPSACPVGKAEVPLIHQTEPSAINYHRRRRSVDFEEEFRLDGCVHRQGVHADRHVRRVSPHRPKPAPRVRCRRWPPWPDREIRLRTARKPPFAPPARAGPNLRRVRCRRQPGHSPRIGPPLSWPFRHAFPTGSFPSAINLPLQSGSCPLTNSKLPVRTAGTYAPAGLGAAGRVQPNSASFFAISMSGMIPCAAGI